MRKIAVLVFAIFFAFMFLAAYDMHDFGAPPSEMDDYIIGGQNQTTGEWYGTQNDTGANNAVTAVVFDYRGYDTLGEATVLFTAIAGVMVVLRRRGKNE
jgi:multisubunit Na+/H+ antiporter MnhB subunit